jgi:hypothetical protein
MIYNLLPWATVWILTLIAFSWLYYALLFLSIIKEIKEGLNIILQNNWIKPKENIGEKLDDVKKICIDLQCENIEKDKEILKFKTSEISSSCGTCWKKAILETFWKEKWNEIIENMWAITTMRGVCPICQKEKQLIPVRDLCYPDFTLLIKKK